VDVTPVKNVTTGLVIKALASAGTMVTLIGIVGAGRKGAP
jgi:hypothetical protein